MSDASYDAILFVSFGGPEGPDDVIPFLENVLRGRNVPRERMMEVAEHYAHFGGVSPINQQNRELIAAVEIELRKRGVTLPIYWGNRNWHPMLTDTVAQMKSDGISSAIAFVTAAFSSYSSCRQYRQNIADACSQSGDNSPSIDKIRVFYNHPDFIAANVDRVRTAIENLPPEKRERARYFFTAHSIPKSMADQSFYETQLLESCRLVAKELGLSAEQWQLSWQSRSGRPEDPWLEPDILDSIRALPDDPSIGVVVIPIGFLSDHMEVMFDLDEEAAGVCEERGMAFSRAQTVGTHPSFVEMVTKLILERLNSDVPRESIGDFGPSWDRCPVNCCPAPSGPRRPVTPA